MKCDTMLETKIEKNNNNNLIRNINEKENSLKTGKSKK